MWIPNTMVHTEGGKRLVCELQCREICWCWETSFWGNGTGYTSVHAWVSAVNTNHRNFEVLEKKDSWPWHSRPKVTFGPAVQIWTIELPPSPRKPWQTRLGARCHGSTLWRREGPLLTLSSSSASSSPSSLTSSSSPSSSCMTTCGKRQGLFTIHVFKWHSFSSEGQPLHDLNMRQRYLLCPLPHCISPTRSSFSQQSMTDLTFSSGFNKGRYADFVNETFWTCKWSKVLATFLMTAPWYNFLGKYK